MVKAARPVEREGPAEGRSERSFLEVEGEGEGGVAAARLSEGEAVDGRSVWSSIAKG